MTFSSVHQVNPMEDYTAKMNIVQYFCFPKYDFEIVLQPEDILLFCSKQDHFLSKKEDCYNNMDVHVTTIYLKTGHIRKK